MFFYWSKAKTFHEVYVLVYILYYVNIKYIGTRKLQFYIKTTILVCTSNIKHNKKYIKILNVNFVNLCDCKNAVLLIDDLRWFIYNLKVC